MFFFVPETFWDRTPQPSLKGGKSTFKSISGFFHQPHAKQKSNVSFTVDNTPDAKQGTVEESAKADDIGPATIAERRQHKNTHHVGFADDIPTKFEDSKDAAHPESVSYHNGSPPHLKLTPAETLNGTSVNEREPTPYPTEVPNLTPSEELHESEIEHQKPASTLVRSGSAMTIPSTAGLSEKLPLPGPQRYTAYLRTQPPKSFVQTLKPWNGKLRHENWFLLALRPFILFAYPSILWSTLIYSLSIGWLIVLSESVSTIYRTQDYKFSALGVGLVYISPFIGGIIGTAVAGKVSDIVVRFMSRRNGGVYEPEFRLVMAIPIAIATVIGLMGFGWSAEEKDNWIVPTIFFGVISFGCSLGSTTAITFAVVSTT